MKYLSAAVLAASLFFISAASSPGATDFVCEIMPTGGDYSSITSWVSAVACDLTASSTLVFNGARSGSPADGAECRLYRADEELGVTGRLVHATATQALIVEISDIGQVPQSGDEWRVDAANFFSIAGPGESASAIARIDGVWTNPSTGFAIDGFTTGSNNTVRIYTTSQARHPGRWDDEAFRVIDTNVYVVVAIRDEFVELDGIQVRHVTSRSYGQVATVSVQGGNTTLKNMVVWGLDSYGNTFRAVSKGDPTGLVFNIYNSIVYGDYDEGITSPAWSGSMNAYNCTVSIAGTAFYRGNGTVHAYNCYGAGLLGFSASITRHNCAASDASGSAGLTGLDASDSGGAYFVSTAPGTEDFALQNCSPLIDQGADLSAIYTTDIHGDSRFGEWDVGADEYVAAANQPPQVNAGSDQLIAMSESAVLAGEVSDDMLPAGTLTVEWSKVSGPGVVTFTNASTAHTLAQFSTNGVYVLRLTASDSEHEVSDDVQVDVRLAMGASGAGSVTLFYSDLVSGPKTGGVNDAGVFVSVFGRNFGSERGAATVTVGGGEVASYLVWTDNRIVFQLGSNVCSGDIVVTTENGRSGGLPFVVRPGRIFFVDDDSPNDPGAGTFEDPWRSPRSFYLAKAAGDTCYFREGSYSGKFGVQSWNDQFAILTSWGDAEGAENNEIAFVGYPGETAVFTDGDGASGNFNLTVAHYVVANLKLQAFTGRSCFTGGRNARVINNYCEMGTNFAYSAIGGELGPYIKIYGNQLTGLRTANKLSHPLYIGYGSDNVDFAWNHIHGNDVAAGPLISIHTDGAILDERLGVTTAVAENKLVDSSANFTNTCLNREVVNITAGDISATILAVDSSSQLTLSANIFTNAGDEYVINVYRFDNIRIRNNIIDSSGATARGLGVVQTGRGSSVEILNNAFIGCGGAANTYWDCAMYIRSANVEIHNNTFYGSRYGTGGTGHIVEFWTGGGSLRPENVSFQNNIINVANPEQSGDYFAIGGEESMLSLTIYANCYHGDGAGPERDGGAVNADPVFVNAAGGDFTLMSSSPCRDAGASIDGTVGTLDLVGLPRVVNGAIDIGACEHVASLDDYDGDGLSNWLESEEHGTDPTHWDTDGDSMSDRNETIAGTDALDSGSLLLATGAQGDGEYPSISWPSASGRTYRIERSLDLLLQPFEPVAFAVEATPDLNTYVDMSAPASSTSCYYRIMVEQAD